MSSTTTSPAVPVDEPSTAERSEVAGVDPVTAGDELPVESPEFGVGQFLPHLGVPAEG